MREDVARVCRPYDGRSAPVAQWLEQPPCKRQVVRSIRTGGSMRTVRRRRFAGSHASRPGEAKTTDPTMRSKVNDLVNGVAGKVRSSVTPH